MTINKQQEGAITIVLILLIITALLALTTVMMSSSVGERKLKENSAHSLQAYLAAESGMEDILIRLKKGWNYSNSYPISIGNASSTINDLGVIGGSRIITSTGESSKRVRKISASYELTTSDVGFHYGAQAGDGGVNMANNCNINGNIYSNGPIIGQGSSLVTGTAIVARSGGYINNLRVNGNAHVDQCQNNSNIQGQLHSTNFGNCSATGGMTPLAEEIDPLDLPVTDEQIDEWKADAQMGGETVGGITCAAAGQSMTMGPIKINGDLIMEKNNCLLTVTGTIWVTGRISLKSSSIRLAGSYGPTSGMVIADGKIDFQTTSLARGSGQSGSYLLVISTKGGGVNDPAIDIGQSFSGDILFTNNGWINVSNSTNIREVTGYGIKLINQAGLTYEIGIASASFSSGPGAVWRLTNWKEVE